VVVGRNRSGESRICEPMRDIAGTCPSRVLEPASIRPTINAVAKLGAEFLQEAGFQ
jgi:hypothetical protein